MFVMDKLNLLSSSDECWIYPSEDCFKDKKIKIKSVVIDYRWNIKTLIVKPRIADTTIKEEHIPIVFLGGICSGLYSWNKIICYLDELKTLSSTVATMNYTYYVPMFFQISDTNNLSYDNILIKKSIKNHFIDMIDLWRKALRIDKCIFVTDGYGAKLAIDYSQTYPNSILKLICVEPIGFEKLPYVIGLPFMRNFTLLNLNFYQINKWIYSHVSDILVEILFVMLYVMNFFWNIIKIRYLINFMCILVGKLLYITHHTLKIVPYSYFQNDERLNYLLYNFYQFFVNRSINFIIFKNDFYFFIYQKSPLSISNINQLPSTYFVYGQYSLRNWEYPFYMKYVLKNKNIKISILENLDHFIVTFHPKIVASAILHCLIDLDASLSPKDMNTSLKVETAVKIENLIVEDIKNLSSSDQ